jgi:predicted transport protein
LLIEIQDKKEILMTDNIDPQTQTMINNMPEKTGKSLNEWYKTIAAAGHENHGAIMKMLKEDYGVTHGFANTISIFYRQQAAGGPPTEDDLVTSQFKGAKEGLRPIYDSVLTAVNSFGSDVEIAPKKSYVSLRRSKQFAIVKAATSSRVDLGLNLKGVESTDRLAGGNAFGGMCTHLVQLTKTSEVDDQVIGWLKQAYDMA